MASTKVNVYLITSDDSYKTITNHMDRTKVMHFSELAEMQLTGKYNNPRFLKNAVTIPKGLGEEKAAARVVSWINKNDIQQPVQLTLEGLGLDQFDEIVYTYATAYAFRLERELRGDDLRNAIYDYMHQGCLRWDEFAMIVEQLAFDGGLVKTAIHEVMFRYCKGGESTPPDMAKIQEYAKKVGMWNEMLAVAAEIKAKLVERDVRDARKAAAEARQEKK